MQEGGQIQVGVQIQGRGQIQGGGQIQEGGQIQGQGQIQEGCQIQGRGQYKGGEVTLNKHFQFSSLPGFPKIPVISDVYSVCFFGCVFAFIFFRGQI